MRLNPAAKLRMPLAGLLAAVWLGIGSATALRGAEKTVELVLAAETAPSAGAAPTAAAGHIVLWKSNLPNNGYATGENRGTVGWFGGDHRLWLQFDLSAIPADAFVISAALRLWQMDRVGQPQGHILDLCAVVKHVEPDSCNWNGPVKGITWTQPGANQVKGATADRSLPVASCTITPHPYAWRQWEVTESVQTMLREKSNHGWVLFDRHLLVNDPNRTSVTFAMPETADATHRPVLVIRYSDTPVERTAANSVLLPPLKTTVVQTRQTYRDGETPMASYRLTRLATLNEALPNGNFSATADRARLSAAAGHQTRVLVKFGSLLPSPSPPTRVRLYIEAAGSDAANQSVQVRRLTEDWRIAEVSWNERRWGSPWKTPGGSAEEIRMPCEIRPTGNGQVLAFDLTEWFLDWQKHPDRNYGVLLTLPVADAGVSFQTDRAEPTHHRPQLEILCGLPDLQ